jgi:hypothetical protein
MTGGAKSRRLRRLASTNGSPFDSRKWLRIRFLLTRAGRHRPTRALWH